MVTATTTDMQRERKTYMYMYMYRQTRPPSAPGMFICRVLCPACPNIHTYIICIHRSCSLKARSPSRIKSSSRPDLSYACTLPSSPPHGRMFFLFRMISPKLYVRCGFMWVSFRFLQCAETRFRISLPCTFSTEMCCAYIIIIRLMDINGACGWRMKLFLLLLLLLLLRIRRMYGFV